jgi:hypothetical protein
MHLDRECSTIWSIITARHHEDFFWNRLCCKMWCTDRHRSEAEVNEESEKDIQEKYQILLHNETGGEHVSETKG